jgi:hypothetical protein
MKLPARKDRNDEDIIFCTSQTSSLNRHLYSDKPDGSSDAHARLSFCIYKATSHPYDNNSQNLPSLARSLAFSWSCLWLAYAHFRSIPLLSSLSLFLSLSAFDTRVEDEIRRHGMQPLQNVGEHPSQILRMFSLEAPF